MTNLSIDPPVRTLSILSKAWRRLRENGPGWTTRRVADEVTAPTTTLGRGLKALFRTVSRVAEFPSKLLLRLILPGVKANNTLYCFYDLRVQPITFDFLWFLTGADIERRRRGLEDLHVVIVPGPEDGFRAETTAFETAVDVIARRWRSQNLLVDSIPLLPSARGFTVCHGREHAKLMRRCGRHVYPNGYSVGFPVQHSPAESVEAGRSGVPVAALRAPEQSLRYAKQWLTARAAGRKPVSITLREYAFEPARNSNVDAWRRFADQLDQDVYFPVIVRDTESSLGSGAADFLPHTVFGEASWNVQLRMALYESCYLNLGVNTGPMALCWLNERARYITFKMIAPNKPQSSERALLIRGLEPNAAPAFAGQAQRWVGKEDRFEVIEREFRDMVARIQSAE